MAAELQVGQVVVIPVYTTNQSVFVLKSCTVINVDIASERVQVALLDDPTNQPHGPTKLLMPVPTVHIDQPQRYQHVVIQQGGTYHQAIFVETRASEDATSQSSTVLQRCFDMGKVLCMLLWPTRMLHFTAVHLPLALACRTDHSCSCPVPCSCAGLRL